MSNLVSSREISLQQLTLACSSSTRPPVEHAYLTHPSMWLCQPFGLAVPFVCADIDVANPRYTPRPLDALLGFNPSVVMALCGCLGSFAVNFGLGGHFDCDLCHWPAGLHCVYCNDCEYQLNSESSDCELSQHLTLTTCSGLILGGSEVTTPLQLLLDDHELSLSH